MQVSTESIGLLIAWVPIPPVFRHRRAIHWQLLSTALVLQAAGARAQTPPVFSLSITEPYELVESVGTTRRITRADIDARNARTLDEALRLLPGVAPGSSIRRNR